MKKKRFCPLSLCLALALVMSTGAGAAAVPPSVSAEPEPSTSYGMPVPDDLVVENLNGQQRMVKTYLLPPEADPEVLKEEDFDYDGFRYTLAFTTKEAHPFLNTKEMTQTVTVETAKKDLDAVLAALSPKLAYDDGMFTGELALDHTTISTAASGYATKHGSITDTKIIGGLDRNDMSYVPATTVKNGKTLVLDNVDWQVTGTALVGEALVPSQYQAVATYSAPTSYQVATGYTSTAEYQGEVTAEGIDSVSYTVVYTGTELVPDSPAPTGFPALVAENPVILVIPVVFLLLLAAAGLFLFLRHKNIYIYQPCDGSGDYIVIAKFKTKADVPKIDLTTLDPYPAGTVAVELRHSLAKKLAGQAFTVHCQAGDYVYTVKQGRSNDWHEFNIDMMEDIVE